MSNTNSSKELQEATQSYFERAAKLAVPARFLIKGLSEVGASPDKLRPVFRKLSLANHGLNDISFLKDYPYLFNVDFQGNQISDLSPLSNLVYLVQIDLSFNNLSDQIYFKGPFNLQDVNLSNNKIQSLQHLSEHRFLTGLCLDNNLIQDLAPLSKCKHLRELHLAGNKISTLAPLAQLPIKTLNASQNNLDTLEGVQHMKSLDYLNVDDNHIDSLEQLSKHPALGTLSITNNKLENVQDISLLSELPLFRYLTLSGNPVLEETSQDEWNPKLNFPVHENAFYNPSFQLYCIYLVPQLRILDGVPVSPEHKVAAINLYNPPTEVQLSIQHMNHEKVKAAHYARIKAEDLLRAKRLRPIVVCGASGSGKRTLTRRLLQEFPHIYGLAVSHTTRQPRAGEEHGVHYFFVSPKEMEHMNSQGFFLEYVKLFGNYYGTSMDSIDKVTEEGKVCILDLEFEGVVALKKSMLKPSYIMIKTPNLDVLSQRLAQSHKIEINDPKLQQWVEKAKNGEYSESDYDITIVNDDLEKSYSEFKEYCLSLYWKAFEEDE